MRCRVVMIVPVRAMSVLITRAWTSVQIWSFRDP